MHRPPAVHFMVHRSRWQGRVLFSLWLSGVGAMVTFFQYQAISIFPALVWAVALVCSAGLAVQTWRAAPSGLLQWNGNTWHWSGFGGDVPCAVVLHMDFQQWLIVSLQQEGGRKVWLWLEATPEDLGWQPLRRALVDSLSGIASTNRRVGISTNDKGPV